MNDGSHGYDVSVGYTFGFCREMSPSWLDLCARVAGCSPPRTDESASFRYLEMGTGQGLGLCLLAATNPHGEFLGIDFHPDHIAHAQQVADAAGLTNIRFVEADFMALADDWPADFGTFDYVAMHGIYSWISLRVREALVACLTMATHAGSLIYNSYNAQPGWLGTMPFQHVTRLLKETTGKPSETVLDDSIALFDRLRAGGAATFQFLPGLRARLESVKTKSAHYLVGEYMHENWHPLWHSVVAGELERADLHYVGSATIADTMLPALLPPALRDTILAQTDARLQQDVQDLVVHQFFRRDLFLRAPVVRDGHASAALAATRLRLTTPPARGAALDIKTCFGDIALQPAAFAQIVAALETGPKRIDQLLALPDLRKQGADNGRNILLLLLHALVLAVEADSPIPDGTAQRLNAVIARGAAQGMPYDHIATARTGSAIPVADVDLILLDGWLTSNGSTDAAALAAGATKRMIALGRSAMEPAQAQAFIDTPLPRWRALGAID